MIVAYERVSSEEQRRAGTIETQHQAILHYCHERQLNLDDTYEDNGITGTVPMETRPAGRRLMEDARKGKIRELVIYNTDRLGRDNYGIIAPRTFSDLRDLGVKVTSITEPMLEDSPSGRFMLNVNSGVAAYDRGKFLQRSREGSLRLATKGNYLGGTIPLGLRVEGANETAHLVLNDGPLPGETLSEAKIVRLIYGLAADGKSCQKVADHLNDTGIATPRCHLGKRARWTREMVRRIVINPVYKGVLTYGKRTNVSTADGKRRSRATPREEWILAKCPAVVDEKIWEQANAAVKRNQIAQMAHSKNEYLLSGLIRCSACGRNYIGVGPRYRCNGRFGAKALGIQKCVGKTVRRLELEAMVWEDLRGFMKQPGPVIRRLEEQLNATDGGRDQIRAEIQEMEKALAKLAKVEANNVSNLNDETITREQFFLECRRIEGQRGGTEQRLGLLQKSAAEIDSSVKVLRTAGALLENLQRITDKNPPFRVRRQIAEALVDHILVETTGAQTLPKVIAVYRFDGDFTRYVEAGRAEAQICKRSRVRGFARGSPGD